MNYLEKLFTLFSDLCGLGVFARDIPSFGCGPAALGRTKFMHWRVQWLRELPALGVPSCGWSKPNPPPSSP